MEWRNRYVVGDGSEISVSELASAINLLTLEELREMDDGEIENPVVVFPGGQIYRADIKHT